MVEQILVGVIVLGAAFWFVRWLKGAARGEPGCGCGKCAKNCSTRSRDCLASEDPVERG